MVRPTARDLTERELDVMHAFWKHGEATAMEVRDRLTASGTDLAYPTVANLVRLLHDKGFLEQVTADKPYRYRAVRSYEEVSRRLLGEVLDRVFRGSREHLLVRLIEQRRLTPAERAILESVLKEQDR